ncbi:MAG: MFS transporter [Candidatus Pacebacteria bacterium]|jgi:MFS family permease|nr:MFS transporter [Candidatus Paceibacterota bacterium]
MKLHLFRKLNPQARILIIADNLWLFGEGMFGPLFAVFAEHIGSDLLDISWAWATYLIINGILVIVFGKISSSIGVRRLLVGGYYLNAIVTFGYLFVDSAVDLLLVQAGLGIAAAMATPTWDALYSAGAKKENERTFLWGLADGQANIFTGLAIIVGGTIVSSYSFTALFVIMGSIQIIAAIYQTKILFTKKHK